jgi:hypothetical protein
MIGPVPNELSCLTATELALISLARVDKHVFSYQGGAHVQMRGWHTMYANDIENINRTANWCSDHLNDNESINDTDDSDEEEDEEQPEQQPAERKKFATICVILSGPFTQEQYNIVKEKTITEVFGCNTRVHLESRELFAIIVDFAVTFVVMYCFCCF